MKRRGVEGACEEARGCRGGLKAPTGKKMDPIGISTVANNETRPTNRGKEDLTENIRGNITEHMTLAQNKIWF